MWGQKQTSTADISRPGRIANVQIALLKVRDFSFLASRCLGLDPSTVKLTFQSRPNFYHFYLFLTKETIFLQRRFGCADAEGNNWRVRLEDGNGNICIHWLETRPLFPFAVNRDDRNVGVKC